MCLGNKLNYEIFPIFEQNHEQYLWKNSNFSTFSQVYFCSLKSFPFYLEYHESKFLGLFCLKQATKMFQFLDQNHGLTPSVCKMSCSVGCLWHTHGKNPVRLYSKLQSQPIGLRKIFIDYLFFQAYQSYRTKSVSTFNRFASSEEL